MIKRKSKFKNPLKPGDTVICVRAMQSQYIKQNNIYTINYVHDGYVKLKEIYQNHDYSYTRFKLIQKADVLPKELFEL